MRIFTPNHVQLLNACYPPASVLLTAGPDYSPNSQELSRLTYYASNHPAKLAKLGTELEKRLSSEARKTRSGNARTRASLLITLAIFRALATECRRDIALLSPSLVTCIDATLEAVPSDLEVVARAASVFSAWTTYTDGHLIGTDSNLTNHYLSALRQFSALSCSSITDLEVRNRTRMIGFAALAGAVNSEALYNDAAGFKAQVASIMQPILTTLFETDMNILEEQAADVKGAPSSPYLAEFRTRPAVERRAASVHVHIDGDKGPSMGDVSNAALRALFSLVGHTNSPQLGFIVQSSFDGISDAQAWDHLSHCCWFAQKVVEWSQYQYRYAVPTWLVERLCQSSEMPLTTAVQTVLAEMATTIFKSPIPLVNLSTSDVVSNLVNLLLRRAESDPDDSLLSALIGCIASLGRHVYYSDQIQDLAGELINRTVAVEVSGVLGRVKASSAKGRSQAVRCLLAALLGLIQSAGKAGIVGKSDTSTPATRATPAQTFKQEVSSTGRVSRRTAVPPDIWQDTLSLLCDSDYSVRADYCEALNFYLSEEMPKDGDAADSKRTRGLTEGPISQAMKINLLLHAGNTGTRFLHAIHAYIYTLATLSPLKLSSTPSTPPSHSTPRSSPNLPSYPDERADSEAQGTEHQANERRSFGAPQNPRVRKTSIVLHLMEQTSPNLARASGQLADYGNILLVLTTIHEELPVRGLLAGVPMLLALESVAAISVDSEDTIVVQRVNAVREVIARVWLVLGGVWNISGLTQLVETALASAPNSLPNTTRSNLSTHLPPRRADTFTPSQSPISVWAGVDSGKALEFIISSPSVHDATGMDREGLLRKLTVEWTPESALKTSTEQSSSYENTVRGDGLTPLLKISPALMHIENISQQSLARSTKGVGVADLRMALEGRSSMSNVALARPASISTLEHAPSTTEGGNLRLTQTRSRSRNKKRLTTGASGDVRDVLNKLGIGKQNGSLLKSSFPSLQKSDQRSPPYAS